MVGFRCQQILVAGGANQVIEMEEPVFLRRLRQQHAGGGGPDRYIAPRNRKTAVDDDEDAPTYVLEGAENETISREEFKAMTSGKGELEVEESKEADPQKFGGGVEGGGEAGAAVSGEEHLGRAKRTNITDIGVKGKKRKAARIGGDDEAGGEEKRAEDNKGKSKTGKKAKNPVKLSFDED